jgi:hypothetical protein
LAIVCLLVGSSIGSGLAWLEFVDLENQFGLQPGGNTVAESTTEGGPKAMIVGESTFDFGKLGPEQTGNTSFVVRNAGDEALELYVQGMTCGKCIQTDFEEIALAPNEELEIPITYATRKPGPEFSEHLEIATNDPARSILHFEITGYVTHAVRTSISEVNFGDLSANESKTVDFRIYGYLSDQLEVQRAEISDSEHADAFDIELLRLSPEEFADEEQALTAYQAKLTAKPGLPLGPINQTIQMDVQANEEVSLELPILGTVVSDITFVGSRQLKSATNTLYFGFVDRKKGRKIPLRMLIKGAHRNDVQLKVSRTDPEDVLRATIGDLQKIANGAIVMYPLTVEVVENARVVNRLGTDQAEAGQILIETTHPLAKEIALSVRFATE